MDFICSLQASDWIDITSICVNAIIGIVITVIVSKRISNRRSLKDYFISEIKDIRDHYRKFLNDLLGSRYDFNSTNSWFQVMNMRLTNLEKTLQGDYNKFHLQAKELNHSLRDLITDHDDFNNSYGKPQVIIEPIHKQEIIKKHAEISSALMRTIIEINNS